jgi:hypothetical protein
MFKALQVKPCNNVADEVLVQGCSITTNDLLHTAESVMLNFLAYSIQENQSFNMMTHHPKRKEQLQKPENNFRERMWMKFVN